MTTTVTFDIMSDNEELQAAIDSIKDDPVMVWRLAVFCSQQQLEKAMRIRAIRNHYDAIHLRARRTREAKHDGH